MTTRRSDVGRRSTVLGRKLGGELLKLRDANQLTQPQAAVALSATQTKIVKIERGFSPVRDPDLHALCDLYGVERDSPARARLLALAKTDRERRRASGWWKDYSDLGDFSEYIQLEDVASTVRTFQHQLVPGLLQTANYARAVAVAHDAWQDPDDIDQFVGAKMARQARLSADEPLVLWAILSEAALWQEVGGERVMREQLEHLIEVGSQPNVKLQIVPFAAGAHVAMGGTFVILGFEEPSALDVVHLDTVSSGRWLESEEDAAQYQRVFDSVRRTALSPEGSRILLESLIKENR